MVRPPPNGSEILAANDVPCAGCGHSLRGLTVDICPECGRAFDRAALAYVSPELGIGAMFQTWAAEGALAAANVALAYELRYVSMPAAPASGLISALVVVRSVALVMAVLMMLACGHRLLGEPSIENRRTTPGGLAADLAAAGASRLPLPDWHVWAWAWGATGVNLAGMAIGWLA